MTSLSRWLDVEVGGDDTELNTLGSNLALLDLNNDNEFKLLVGDFGRDEEGSKLRVYKGASQIADVTLPDLPLGIVGVYSNETNPRSQPIIAVAFSSCIYMYRNLKLYYKYYVPSVDLSTCEVDVWKQLTDPSNHTPESIEKLTGNLKSIPPDILTRQSHQFLTINPERQLEYLEHGSVGMPSRKPPEITCITVMKMSSVDRYSMGCLVIGTEDGDVIVIDSQTFSQLHQARVCEVKRTPYQLAVTGLYNVDYRITIASREKSVCILKREAKAGRVLFNTDEHIIAIEVMSNDHTTIVLCTDNSMACYSKKGTKQWSIFLEHRPVAMTTLPIFHLGVTLVGVALASGHVQLYDGKAMVDSMFVRDVVSVMKFGQLGQEEHVLTIVTAGGNLMLKILKRTADFSTNTGGLERSSVTSLHQTKPWLIPKKSKLFLEQSMRERENAIVMHESFQRELNRLRLLSAQALIEAYTKSDNSVALGTLEPVQLSAEVEGLGPIFRVTLIVENTSTDKAIVGLSILFHLHYTNYKVTNPYIKGSMPMKLRICLLSTTPSMIFFVNYGLKVPLLSPSSTLKFPTKVEEIFEASNPDVFFRAVTGQSGERALVKVLLMKQGQRTPVLAATVQMPPTDPMMMPFEEEPGFGTAAKLN